MPKTQNPIRALCVAIEAGYDAGKSGMDDDMIQHLIDLGDHAAGIVSLIDTKDDETLRLHGALRSARELLGELLRTVAANDQADAIDTVLQAINACVPPDEPPKARFTVTVEMTVEAESEWDANAIAEIASQGLESARVLATSVVPSLTVAHPLGD